MAKAKEECFRPQRFHVVLWAGGGGDKAKAGEEE